MFGRAAWVAALFVLAAVAIALLVMWRTSDLLVKQVVTSLEHEAEATLLEYRRHGLSRVTETVARKSAVNGLGLYHLENSAGVPLAGNLNNIPEDLRARKKGGVFRYSSPRSGPGLSAGSSQTANTTERSGVALRQNLGTDGVLFLGRDIEDVGAFSRWLRWFLFAAFAALTLAAIAVGYATSRAFLNRLATVNTAAQSIMQGDLTERIPLSGQHDELDDLSRNLNQMLDRINQLMFGLREVSDNIAHDLKTPLNRLRNRAEGALRDPRGGDAYREGLERTIEEADGLIRTFNALLLIARLEAGSIEETAVTFNLAEILDDVGELYQPVAEENGLTIETSAPQSVPLHANKQLIVQALANLIDNAIKYGRKSEADSTKAQRVTARVRVEDNLALIEVSDHGPGISPEDHKRVLNRFVRLEQSRTQPGTGLGLSLVAAVARMHGGTVELADNNPGLRVTLKLPQKRGSETPEHPAFG